VRLIVRGEFVRAVFAVHDDTIEMPAASRAPYATAIRPRVAQDKSLQTMEPMTGIEPACGLRQLYD